MMSRPDLYLEKFVSAGADSVQIHVEADCDVHDALACVRALGAKNAIVFNPETPAEAVLPYLGEVDGVLVMTVHPGYGGQAFIEECLPKIARVRAAAPSLDLMVDGGVNAATAARAAAAGANQLVAGSYLFAQKDMAAAVAGMREVASCAR
jgi:ribulose-phosphate 3-epimerase